MQLESMASLRTILPLLTLLLVLLASTSEAREFVVGGNNCSWEVPSPTSGSECLNEWAKANRFRVGDALLFEYEPELDSVLRVTKDDYEKCNKAVPMAKYEDGKTKLELNQSGSFYFIGGDNGGCENGQKLIVTVVSHEAHHHAKHAMMRAVQAPTPAPNPTTPSTLMAPPPNGGAALGLKSGFMATLVGVGTVMWMVLF